jgi:hypothetical protein
MELDKAIAAALYYQRFELALPRQYLRNNVMYPGTVRRISLAASCALAVCASAVLAGQFHSLSMKIAGVQEEKRKFRLFGK